MERKQLKVSERKVANSLKIAVTKAGGMILKVHPLTNSGLPDYLVHIGGVTFYVETKTTGEKCTKLQLACHKRLYKMGVHTYVLDRVITDIRELFIYGQTALTRLSV